MSRSKIVPILGVVIALLVLIYIFVATRPEAEDAADGVVGADVGALEQVPEEIEVEDDLVIEE